jgi:hypothetical protein
MVGRQFQLLSHAILTPATNNFGLVWKSRIMQYNGETGWLLVVQNGAAITGTTPGVIWELDVSDNGGAYTAVGSAISTYAAVGWLCIPYILNSTQGAVCANTAGHKYLMQVVGTLGFADNVATDVSVDLFATI